ncbi:MAG: hypothetical protein M1435_00410, partial [Actinobacteria bacterium]|nr:hypothetical protein [Actinomycetota bacterium]
MADGGWPEASLPPLLLGYHRVSLGAEQPAPRPGDLVPHITERLVVRLSVHCLAEQVTPQAPLVALR